MILLKMKLNMNLTYVILIRENKEPETTSLIIM